jgi:hypothetical protein
MMLVMVVGMVRMLLVVGMMMVLMMGMVSPRRTVLLLLLLLVPPHGERRRRRGARPDGRDLDVGRSRMRMMLLPVGGRRSRGVMMGMMIRIVRRRVMMGGVVSW